MIPPTFKLSPIPAPPAMTKAPSAVVVESVEFVTVVIPAMLVFKPTPRPPSITKAPVEVEVDSVLFTR